MDKIIIHGGHHLAGSVKISGSKNSALPILAATLLTKETCVIQRVPDLSDVHYMLQILAHLGADVGGELRLEKGAHRAAKCVLLGGVFQVHAKFSIPSLWHPADRYSVLSATIY